MAKRGDAIANHATIDLELGLALTKAATDAATGLLLGKMAPHAAKTWEQILELGKLHLQASLTRSGMEAEDVEDQGRAVDDLDGFTKGTFQI